ncbi:hypothetical protein V7075_14085 [Neobacillus drentensis]|uniref:hypothetical protein n=1 Tax=Neobacillus drentensis TaxID=220684 RepID=UPI002FFF8419
MVHGQKLIVITPSQQTKSLAKDILSFFKKYEPKSSVTIGISNHIKDPGDYTNGYTEAKKAAEFADLFGKSNDFGIIGVLFQAHHLNSMRAFRNKYIEALVNYDSNQKADLLESLKVFLDHESGI